MKYAITAVLAIATFAIMMTSATSAFGQATTNVHAVDPVPLSGPPNTLFAMQSVASQDQSVPLANLIVDIYLHRAFVLYDPNVGALIPSLPVGPNSCDTYTVQPGDRLWELQNTATGAHIEASHDQISQPGGSSIYYDQTAIFGPSGAAGDGFGNGAVAANLDTIGTATFYNQNASPALNDWVELNAGGFPTGNSDQTSQSGAYLFVVCGWVDTNGNGVWDGAGTEAVSKEERGFLIDAVVGGETMPISATSLLVAGASANALWILPILGLAGTIIAIRKLEA